MLESIVNLDCGNGPIEPSYNAYTSVGDNAASIVPAFDTEVDTSSTLEAVRSWLQQCCCVDSARSFKPTRLLHIGSNEDFVTLIETCGTKISNYACLSYCWGGSQPVINSTLRALTPDGWQIYVRDLPNTFKDAITTLRRLGFEYVWIDSLCIVQDDQHDKDREIHKMPLIYKNAHLTLCASTARSCSEGFLHPRPDYSDCQLRVCKPNGEIGTILMDQIPWISPLVTEPLGTRAWAFQERLLSPRLLEYGWRTLRWGCSCSARYSGYQPLTVPPESNWKAPAVLSYNLFGYLDPNGLRRMPQHKDELFDHWNSIVDRYTRRNLTYPDDRLAAIGGVATELQARTVNAPLGGHEDLRPRPKASRAPSWSWTAVDGPISINHSREIVQSFRVLETEVHGGFGLSARGSITVQGPVNPLLVQNAAALDRGACGLRIYPDCAGELAEITDDESLVEKKPMYRLSDMTFLAIGRANWDREIVRGLLLVQNGDDHRRVGYFQLRSTGRFLIEDWRVQRLRIV
ncbi:heterokaryon incompatibility protein-domain-containing protein [Hyaloscypha finlandica]|nr:heterokaryon incompatibility protein-domain-containing protein [Hyaloscypha finlandica]